MINLIARAMPIAAKIEFLNVAQRNCQGELGQRFSLGRLLYGTRGLSVKYGQDRVKAILGMCNAEDFSELTVIKCDDAEQLSRRVTDLLLEREELFLLVYHLAPGCQSTSSWKVDLSFERSMYNAYALDDSVVAPWAEAATHLFSASRQERLDFSREGDDILRIRGYLIDNVNWRQVNAFTPIPGRNDLDPERIKQWHAETEKEIKDEIRRHKINVADELLDRFDTTIVAGGRLHLAGHSVSAMAENLPGHIAAFREALKWIAEGNTASSFTEKMCRR